MDGNLSVEHMKMKYPEDDVFLSDGMAFMVGQRPYQSHLTKAVDRKEVCDRRHHVVDLNQRFLHRNQTAATTAP